MGFECTGYFSVAAIKPRNQKQLVPDAREAYMVASGQNRKLRGHISAAHTGSREKELEGGGEMCYHAYILLSVCLRQGLDT